MIEEILDKARWFYIPYQPYKGFYHLIVEDAENDWTFYYLEEISSAGQVADVSGMLNGLDMFNDPQKKAEVKKPENPRQEFLIPSEYSEVRKYEVFRLMEKESSKSDTIDRNISDCGVVREVHGNLGAMIHELQKNLN